MAGKINATCPVSIVLGVFVLAIFISIKKRNFCNVVEGHCLQAMKIVRHHANGRFDWLISGQQSVNPSREVISMPSDKYKRFTFVHPVAFGKYQTTQIY